MHTGFARPLPTMSSKPKQSPSHAKFMEWAKRNGLGIVIEGTGGHKEVLFGYRETDGSFVFCRGRSNKSERFQPLGVGARSEEDTALCEQRLIQYLYDRGITQLERSAIDGTKFQVDLKWKDLMSTPVRSMEF